MLYLDHAATSRPKAPGVVEAICTWYDQIGVSADRGDSDLCLTAAALADELRRRLGRLCGLPRDRVAFTSGATESINLFLRGYLRPGDKVLTTALEHSSVARPLRALALERDLHLDVIQLDARGALDSDQFVDAIREHHRLVVFTHASNVTGQLLPAQEICTRARELGVESLVDASQTAGLCSLDCDASALAFSAHKGMLGPPGLGVLATRAGLDLRQSKQGGSGSSHSLDQHPTEWPTAFEAGTPNTPAMFGLAAALDWLEAQAPGHLLQAGRDKISTLHTTLKELDTIRCLHTPALPSIPILSIAHHQRDSSELGALLAADGIHARSGYHCAPWIHSGLGTQGGGTLRLSPGPFVTKDELLEVISSLARA